jgi:Fe-S cluster assembly protein SufD
MIDLQTKPSLNATDVFVSAFEQLEHAGEPAAWLYPLRKAGIAGFAELGFPTLKHEDWRFTNLAPLTKLPLHPAPEPAASSLTKADLRQFLFSDLETTRLVFVDGHFSPELSTLEPVPAGVKIGSLAAALSTPEPLLEKHLARCVAGDENPFAALNTALFRDGAFIYVPAEQSVLHPVHLLFISRGQAPGATVQPRNLIIAERNSKLTVLESYVSLGDAASFTNAMSEFIIGDGAQVEHCKVQDENLQAFHVATLHSRIGRSARFISHSFALGARLSRNNLRTTLAGEGLECVLNGLYVTRDEQLADHHMVVEHAAAHCASHEYFNGILDGRSRGVFHGRILVQPGAQKTDAKQTNKNLLLTDDATANTKPQLEIYADDVKCTHGATIGQLDEDAIFYLRARGIGLDTARRMLIHAFAGEIIDRIQCEPVRERLDQVVWDRLEQSAGLAVGK